MKHYLLFLLALAALTSCSITKREYMPGYDVQWHNKKEAVTAGVPKQRSEKVRELSRHLDTSLRETRCDYALNDTLVDNAFAKAEKPVAEVRNLFTHLPIPLFAPVDKAAIKQFNREYLPKDDEIAEKIKKHQKQAVIYWTLAVLCIFPGFFLILPLLGVIPFTIAGIVNYKKANKLIKKNPSFEIEEVEKRKAEVEREESKTEAELEERQRREGKAIMLYIVVSVLLCLGIVAFFVLVPLGGDF